MRISYCIYEILVVILFLIQDTRSKFHFSFRDLGSRVYMTTLCVVNIILIPPLVWISG